MRFRGNWHILLRPCDHTWNRRAKHRKGANRMKVTGFAVGMAAGMAAGAFAGMRIGANRREIRSRMRQAADRAEDAFDRIVK